MKYFLPALVLGLLWSFNINAETRTFKTRDNWVTQYLANGGKIEHITGLAMPQNWLTSAQFEEIEVPRSLPTSFNWADRTPFGLQPIRNQKSCGSCWAFATTAVLEALWILVHPGEYWPDFSEQELVSTCSKAGDCGGGYFDAFDYMENNGLSTEKDIPYLAKNSSCKKADPKAKILRWSYIKNPNTENIKAALLQYGPIACDIYAGGQLMNYSSGVYNSCVSGNLNHMITIEGWNDEGGYWIMRNSWGTGWGMNGYMNIKYTSKTGRKCNNICSTAAFAEIDPRF